MRRLSPTRLLLVSFLLWLLFPAAGNFALAAGIETFEVTDIFGRVVNQRGLTLLDWEGFMANPAIKFFIKAPPESKFPVTTVLLANGDRLYFDLPSSVGKDGPTKTVVIPDASARVPVFMSIFPDRDGLDEEYELLIRAEPDGPVTRLPVQVIDQDKTESNRFNVTVDFSRDQTGFFADPRRQEITRQAAQDWAWFFDDMHLAKVPPGAAGSLIWNTNGFTSGHRTRNDAAYQGFLLYAYGIHSPEVRSGGEPSVTGGFQHGPRGMLPLRRTGGFEAEIAGNYNTLGWLFAAGEENWWTSGNLRDEPADFYSIAHHEIGHALIFNPGHPWFGRAKTAGRLEAPAIVAYHGRPAHVDKTDHLDGEVDDASLRGAFGNEYHGSMPQKRWLATKLDLLAAQAIGYKLRPVSAFIPLTLKGKNFPPARFRTPYRHRVEIYGGIPAYHVEIINGVLPPGLTLDSFTGMIEGVPVQTGKFPLVVRVTDQTPRGAAAIAALKMIVR
ncbi:MAG TPA: putative Ig domain-containing protein [Verrucomicrobiae bacterium]|nr:putative Ig domain-containing protein [Verrucomicrobiae bacterium]